MQLSFRLDLFNIVFPLCVHVHLVVIGYVTCVSFEAEASGTKAINRAMAYMYSAGFWLPRARGVRLGQLLMTFVQCYGFCARKSFEEERNRFPLMP